MSCGECGRLAVAVGWARNDVGDGRRKLARMRLEHEAAEYAPTVKAREQILADAVVKLEAHQAGCEDYADRPRGGNVGRPLLSNDEIAELQRRRDAGETVRDLALAYGVSEGAISKVTTGAARRFIRTDEPWMEDALCAQMGDPDAFFPEKGDSVAAARRVCQLCEVSDACREYGIRTAPTHGMWGGLTYRDLQAIRRERELEAHADLPVPSEANEPGPGGEATTSAA